MIDSRSSQTRGVNVSIFRRIGLSFYIKLAISILALSMLIWWLPADKIFSALGSITFQVWFIAILVFLSGHVIAAQKWRLLLLVVGVPSSFAQVIRAHAAGLFANLCLPSIVGGDVVRASIVANDRRSIEQVAVAGLADRLIDTIGLLLLVLFGWSLASQNQSIQAMSEHNIFQYAVLAVCVLLVLVLASMALIAYGLPDRLIPHKTLDTVLRLRESIGYIVGTPQLALGVLFISMCIQSLFIMANVYLAKAVGLDLELGLWFYAWPLAKLCALLPVSLAGIGIRDVALVGILFPFGIDSALVAGQSFSWQVVMIFGGLLSGLFVLLSKFKRR